MLEATHQRPDEVVEFSSLVAEKLRTKGLERFRAGAPMTQRFAETVAGVS